MKPSALSAIVVSFLFVSLTGSAAAVDLQEVVFAQKLGEQMEAIKPGNKFAPDATIYLSAVVKGRPTSGKLKCRFYYRDQLISEADIDFATVNKGLLFSFGQSTNVGFHLEHESPFPVSRHFRTELFADGKKLGSYPFHVVPPANAGPSKLLSANLAGGIDDDFNPVNKTQAFRPADTVYLSVRANVGLDTWVQAEWMVSGKVDDTGTRSLTFQENATDTGLAFSFVPEGGWPEGEHEVVLTINDEEAARRKFTVSKTPPEKPTKAEKPAERKMSPKRTGQATITDPKTADEFNARGEEHYNEERFEDALADFNQALKLDPKNGGFMSNRGWVFYQQDDPDTALLEFDEALSNDSTLVHAYWGRATVHNDAENWPDAIVNFTHAIRNATDKRELAQLYTDRGRATLSSGNVTKALRDFDRAIFKDPDYVWSHANRGSVLTDQGNYEEAVASLRRAIELDSQIAELHDLLGAAFEDSGDVEAAIKAYTDAILLDLENIDYHQKRARVHQANGDLDSAVKDLKRAIAIDPNDSVSHNNLGLVYAAAGELDAGIRELNTALELDSQNAIFWYNRGELHFLSGMSENAISDLNQTLVLDNDDPDAYALRGKVLEQSGDAEAAARDYAQAISLAPNHYRMAAHKYLRIANATEENLRVWVQYFTDDWNPEGAMDEGRMAAVYEFAPDENEALSFNDVVIHGSRFRIWALGLESGREYVAYRDKDYVLVPETGYITSDSDLESGTFTFTRPDKTTPTPTTLQPLPRSSTIHAVAYGEQDGKAIGVCFPVKVTVDKNPTQTIETAFSLSQAGSTWRAAGLMATVLAADVVGLNPLATQVNFETSQDIDGPSAGGLMTVGVLATLRGDPVRQDVAMTGIINPDGTIGPVGGIPHKLEGAAATGKKVFLTPFGKRYEVDGNTGRHVDLFERGRELGLEVHAVGDLYSAYELLTGVKLPRAEPARAPQLDVDMYKRVVHKVIARFKQYESLAATWKTLPARYHTEDGNALMTQAHTAAARVTPLLNEGLAPTAFQDAMEAAEAAAVAVELNRVLQVLDRRGINAGKAHVRKVAIEDQWQSAVTSLRQYQPQTLSGVGVLIHGYSTLLQGMACQEIGEQFLDGRLVPPIEGSQARKDVMGVLLSAAYIQIAQKNYENIAEVLDIAGSVQGRALDDDAPYYSTTMFLKNAAIANLNQFEQVIVNGRAEAAKISFEQMQSAMMQQDKIYLVTRFSIDHALPKLLKTLDEDPALIYAHLGSSLQVYVMASRLLSDYYSLGVTHDDDGNIDGILSESPLKYMLDFSEDQVRRNIQVLRDHEVEPMASVFFCQVGSSLRGRELEGRLGALTSFWQANVQARALAYLGGFAAPGE